MQRRRTKTEAGEGTDGEYDEPERFGRTRMRLKTYNFQDKDLYMNYSEFIYEGDRILDERRENRKQKVSGRESG